MRALPAVIIALLCSTGCGRSRELQSLNCPAGAHDEGGTCIVDITCGPGTHQVGSVCFAVDAGVQPAPEDLAMPGSSSYDFAVSSWPGRHDLAMPDLAPPSDLAMSWPQTAPCNTDTIPSTPASGSVTVPPASDVVGLCDGWVALADRDQNRLVRLNLFTAETAAVQLPSTPVRLALDSQRWLLYASLYPATQIAKLDLTTSLLHKIDGAAVYGISVGNQGQVVGTTPASASQGTLLQVFDGIGESLLTSLLLDSNIVDLPLVAYDQAQNQVVVAEIRGINLYRYSFDPSSLTANYAETLWDIADNGKDLTMSDDGQHVAFAAGGGNTDPIGYAITDIASDDFTQIYGAFTTGPYPNSAAFSPDGKYFAASNTESLMVFSAATHALVASVALASSDRCIFADYRVGFSRGSKLAFMVPTNCTGVLTWTALP